MRKSTAPLRVLRGVLALAAAAAVTGASCGGGASDARNGRVQVVAGFARLAELADLVGGPRVEVHDLTPAGAEPHDLELAADDIDRVEDADVVLYLGGGFQPAIERAARRARRAVDVLSPDGGDPHVWLDPLRFAAAADTVGGALAAVDPAGAAGHRSRATRVRAELERLHADYAAGLRDCRRRVIVTSHAAFGRLTARYGLREEPVTGASPDAEPDPRRLSELSDLIRRHGITAVFAEPLAPGGAVRTLARETGVDVVLLDTLEGPADDGYVAGMRQNLAVLREALACR